MFGVISYLFKEYIIIIFDICQSFHLEKELDLKIKPVYEKNYDF